MEQHRHRTTTSLKQSNKAFKSRHASKATLKDKSKGKVHRVSIKHAHKHASSKADRRNAAKLQQIKKREELMRGNRIFEGKTGVPRIVAVLSLCQDFTSVQIAQQLAQSLEETPPSDDHEGLFTIDCARFRQKMQLIVFPPMMSFYDILDACKVADFVVLGLSAEQEVGEFGESVLRAVQQQGLGNIIPVVPNLEDIPTAKRSGIRKSLSSFIQYFFPEDSKVHATDAVNEALNVVRSICTSHPKQQKWRDTHAYIVAEETQYDPNEQDGMLRVTGYVRGSRLSANRLIHIQNHGDFQIEKVSYKSSFIVKLMQISSCPIPSSHQETKMAVDTNGDANGHGMEAQAESVVLDTPTAERDDLVAENDPDFMGNEQTWPTEEEMRDAADNGIVRAGFPDAPKGTTPRRVKRVPKGTSDYQATWILDSEDEDEDNEDEEGDVDMQKDEDDAESDESEEYEYLQDDNASMAPVSESYQDMDEDEEQKQLDRYREEQRERRKMQDELEFPDEIDTPFDVPARTRFQRYRGLKSFRTSPWDPFENLPTDYARIFQFENQQRTNKRVLNATIAEGVKPGTRVHIYIRMSRDIADKLPSPARGELLTLFSLLQHEHKTSVLNFSVTKNTEYEDQVRSKEDLIIQIGFRRVRANPIFSQASGKGTNNVHKFERWFVDGTSVGTIFGPVTWGNAPVLVFKPGETSNEPPRLVGSGTLIDMDTTRIVAKRIILTGHPFKIHKKSATTRFMFFNRDDVLFFKPVQLYTKYGRRGHIIESLGTHGYFKAGFDGSLNAQDTVCMALYKRTFPKFSKLYRQGREET